MYLRSALAACASLLISSISCAQNGPSMGSISFASLAHDTGHANRAQSVQGGVVLCTAEISMGQNSTGFVAVGRPGQPGAYTAVGGIYLVDPTILDRRPMVFGLDRRFGGKAGGERATLFGAFLNSAAGQFPAIFIGPRQASGVRVVDDARIELTIPNGEDPLSGNPVGRADLTYFAPFLGSPIRLEGAYTFAPALGGPAQVSIGTSFALQVQDLAAARLVTLLVGLGPAQIPWAPFGAFSIWPVLQVYPFTLAPSGTLSFPLSVPADPNLIALPLIFQALSLDASAVPLAGSFTNPHFVRIAQ